MFTIENMPYISLCWIGIGFFLMILSVLIVAAHQSKKEEYTSQENPTELFSFFLQEEEKKNNQLREAFKKQSEVTEKQPPQEMSPSKHSETHLYQEILKLYEKDVPIETIAKQMKVGVGEVRLIISLSTMR
ncbi:MAG: DUF6115 domain-containing protein [Cellulosilyticaceae bacterium]